MHIESLPAGHPDETHWVHAPLLRERVSHLVLPPPEVNQGVRLRIGLACEEGTVQRIIHTDSMLEAVHVFETLRDVGYEPASLPATALRLDRLYKPSGGPLVEERSSC